MSKFKIGETIFSMELNKPVKHVIEGISKLEGKAKTIYETLEIKEGETLVRYHSGYSVIKEDDAFASLDQLKQHVFSNLKLDN